MTENHGKTYWRVTSVLVYKSATISDLQWYRIYAVAQL